MSYRNLAVDAMTKCVGYDPAFPRPSEVMIQAWSEALEVAGIDTREDVLMAVRVMYATHGDPGWRPTPKVLVETARECRKLRREREAAAAEKAGAIEEAPKITLAEWEAKHGTKFPKFQLPDIKKVTHGD